VVRALPLLWVLVVFAATTLAPTAAASTSATTRPNIRQVEVSANRYGALVFRVVYTESVTLPATTVLDVIVDADDDPNTGDEGFETVVDYSPGISSGPYVSLFTAADESGDESRPEGLEFVHDGPSSTFTVPTVSPGFPASFDYSFSFYVYMEIDGEFVDAAPTHVLISTTAKPFEVDASKLFAGETIIFEDLADGTPAEDSLVLAWVIGGVLTLGAVLGLAGWSVERLRRRASTSSAPDPKA
jgi:hypothetical protein